MNKKNGIEVIINGKRVSLAGYESEEYMQKLDHFVTIRTQSVKQLNNQWMLRDKYNEVSQYYK